MKVGSRRSLTACSHRWARCRRQDGGYVVSDIGGGVRIVRSEGTRIEAEQPSARAVPASR